jgi:DNA-binding FadR family transcriptional regulator
MHSKLKSMVLGGVIAGSLIMSAGPAMARDYWHWSERGQRWSRRADLRSDYRDLAQARRQLEFDRAHHASRRRIAQDLARIRDIEADIRADRRELARW